MNKISILPNLPPSLTEFDVSFNRELTALPPLPGSLKKLDIQYTLVKDLPANLPPELEYLKCSHTPIKILPNLPGSLRDLYIEETQITSLPQLPDKLETLIYNDKYIHCIPCKNTHITVIEAGINKTVTPVFCNASDISNTNNHAAPIIQGIKKCLSGNCNNGIGTLESDNSEEYITYKGGFKNALYNGQGTLIVKDKYKYTGSFKDGKFDGNGIFTSIEYGYTYAGDFKQNNWEGAGTLISKDKKKSTGTWKENRLWSGTGLLTFGEKESYYGEVKENMPDGQGIRSFANGKQFTGTFSKGKPVTGNGYFLSEREKGTYEGELKNGQPDGYGEMTESDGWFYKGMWANGKRNGQGAYYDSYRNLIYSGQWTNGSHEKNPEKTPEIKVGDKKDDSIVYWVDVSGKHGLIANVDDLGEYNWKDAIRVCNALGHGWHLPDRIELERLYKNKNVVAKFSTSYGFSNEYYWSSSEVVYEGYGIHFGNGSGTTLNGGGGI